MWAASQFVRPGPNDRWANRWIAILALVVSTSLSVAAQGRGPHTTTTVGGHFLAPAPSVTSIGGRHLPPPAPSVTSLPNFSFQNRNSQIFTGRHGGRGFRNGGFGYAIPYYYPFDNSAYGYDYVGDGGPDLYSGPPLGSNDQTMHIVVEQPPARPYMGDQPDPDTYDQARTVPAQPAPEADLKPAEPSVLVFRTGKQQEVTNYAIMGDTVYVFDEGRKTIALADLDIPATIKANEDRGLEFRVPASAIKPKNSSLPQGVPAPESTTNPASVASAMP